MIIYSCWSTLIDHMPLMHQWQGHSAWCNSHCRLSFIQASEVCLRPVLSKEPGPAKNFSSMSAACGKAGLAPKAVQLQAATIAPSCIALSRGILCVTPYSMLPMKESPAPVVSSIASYSTIVHKIILWLVSRQLWLLE